MGVVESFDAAVGSIVAFLPSLVAAIIILIIAWIVGRAVGKLVSAGLDKAGVDDALRKTVIGKSIESSGTSIPHVFDLIVRWFIYIIGIMAAVNVLGIPMLTAFTQSVVLYIPNLIAALIVLVIGFIFADIVGDLIRRTGTASEVPYMGIFSTAIEVFLYFIVIIIALDQLRINTSIIYVFATALAWGIAIGAGVGLGVAFGFGLKDKMPRLLESVTGAEAKQKLQKIEETAQPEPVSRPARRPGAVPE
jgi:small-conductance mechanosensitive channel